MTEVAVAPSAGLD